MLKGILSFDSSSQNLFRQMVDDKLPKNYEPLPARILELEREREALQLALAARDAQLATRDAEIAVLRGKLHTSELERADLFEQLHDAQLIIEGDASEQLQEQLNQRNAQLTAAQEEIYSLRGQVDALLEERSELQAQREEAQDARDVMEGNLNDAHVIIAQQEQLIGHLQVANAQLNAVLNAQPPVPLAVIPPDDADLSEDGDSGVDYEAPPGPGDMEWESDGSSHAE